MSKLYDILSSLITRVKKAETQPDWNQNDATAPDYVKNRLAWTDDPVEKVLLEETELTFVDGGTELPTPISLTEGRTYIVTYNGNAYDCIAWFWEAEGIVFIGNGAAIGESAGNDEPFLTDGTFIMSLDASATIRVIEVVEEIHQIDPKYIKDMYYTDDPKETVLIEEQTVTVGDVLYAELNGSLVLEVGKTYTVNFNGTTYECVAYSIPDTEGWENTVFIGNAEHVGLLGGNGEPFAFDSYPEGNIYLDTPETGDYIISISGEVAEVHRIDEKYLPDEYDVIIKASDYGNISPRHLSFTKGNFDTLVDCFENRKPPKVLIDGTFYEDGMFGAYSIATNVCRADTTRIDMSFTMANTSYVVKAKSDGTWLVEMYRYGDDTATSIT